MKKTIYTLLILIGTTCVSLSQTTHNTGQTTLTNPTVGGRTLEIRQDDTPFLTFHDPGTYWYSMGIQSTSGLLKIGYGGNLDANNHFVMNSSGNIGIGTTTLDYKLQVNGEVYSSEGFKVGETVQMTQEAMFNGYQHSTSTDATYGIKIMRYLAHNTQNTGGVYGIHSIAGPSFTANAQNVYGIYTQARTFHSGTATNAYSLFSESPTGAITNSFNIYASGSSNNYFEGNIGIGTLSPSKILTLRVQSAQDGIRLETSTGRVAYLTNLGSGTGLNQGLLELFNSGTSAVKLAADGSTNSYFNAGNVGIGTTTPNHKLEVNGTIRSKKIRVEASPWPDYVFEPEFDLRPLKEVEQFIKTNKHLPEVPSAKEVEENGLDLGAMDATLLKKVEELTLYMIEKDKQVENLKKENMELNKTNSQLKSRLDKIEALLNTVINEK